MVMVVAPTSPGGCQDGMEHPNVSLVPGDGQAVPGGWDDRRSLVKTEDKGPMFFGYPRIP